MFNKVLIAALITILNKNLVAIFFPSDAVTHHDQLSFHKLPENDEKYAQSLANLIRDWRS